MIIRHTVAMDPKQQREIDRIQGVLPSPIAWKNGDRRLSQMALARKAFEEQKDRPYDVAAFCSSV